VGSTTYAFTDALLDEKRRRGDPEADAVMSAIHGAGQVDAIDATLLALRTNDQVVPAGLPAPVRDYFARPPDLGEVDQARLDRGQDVFTLYGPEVLVCLATYGLPASYAARKGVQVLYRTAFLERRPMRRVLETARLLVEVLTQGCFSAEGQAVRSLQKVRLMHAAIRHRLQHHPTEPWDPALGVPINQEDLAGTLMAFSYLLLSGIKTLGIDLATEEQDGYLYTWSIAGRLLGLDDDLNPVTLPAAAELTQRIGARQFAPSPEGQALTRALIDGFDRLLPELPDHTIAAMVHYFFDHDTVFPADLAAILDVPPGGWDGALLPLVGFVDKTVSHLGPKLPAETALMRWLSRQLVKAMVTDRPDERRATFSIPDHLRDSWRLDVPGARV
jgi:hypothetical protein